MQFYKLKYLLGVICFCLPVSIFSQQVQVKNSLTGQPVENVAVITPGLQKKTLTDRNGMFETGLFKPGDSLCFQHISFRQRCILFDSLEALGWMIQLEPSLTGIDELVVTGSRMPEERRSLPGMIDRISSLQISAALLNTSSDLLALPGNILVQKSQGGGGSPILRGFEANRILLVVDGVRMNNAIYRSGHLQNSLSLDAGFLDHVEILYGPAAVMHGSDALGGVIQYFTREPQYRQEGQKPFTMEAGISYGSAWQGSRQHLDFSLAGERLASAGSITVSDYDDLRAGKQRSPWMGDYGKSRFIVERIAGKDSSLVNPHPEIQPGSGYRQYDLVQKLKMKLRERDEAFVNFQFSTTTNINRNDYLNDLKDGLPKYAEWYYGPQKRLMLALGARLSRGNAFYTSFSPLLAYQRVAEDRINRNFRSNNRYRQLEDVDVLSLSLDFRKLLPEAGTLGYGAEGDFNYVASEGSREDITNGLRAKDYSRYPDEGSVYTAAAAYLYYASPAIHKLSIRAGMRYNYTFLSSRFSELFSFADRQFEMGNDALTGSLGLVYLPSDQWKFDLQGSTGFRTPNVDDIGKLRAKNGEVTIPNPDLQPEYSWNLDAGAARKIGPGFSLEAHAYASLLKNAIVMDRYTFNDSDSLQYQGDWYKITANTNHAEALLYGVSASAGTEPGTTLQFRATVNYTKGKDLSTDSPLGHIPPLFGRLSLGKKYKSFSGETWLAWSGWKHLKDMDQSAGSEDNIPEATAYGYPAWYTLNVRVGYQWNRYLHFTLGVENLTDNFYKSFASGIPAAGRNILLSAKAVW